MPPTYYLDNDFWQLNRSHLFNYCYLISDEFYVISCIYLNLDKNELYNGDKYNYEFIIPMIETATLFLDSNIDLNPIDDILCSRNIAINLDLSMSRITDARGNEFLCKNIYQVMLDTSETLIEKGIPERCKQLLVPRRNYLIFVNGIDAKTRM